MTCDHKIFVNETVWIKFVCQVTNYYKSRTNKHSEILLVDLKDLTVRLSGINQSFLKSIKRDFKRVDMPQNASKKEPVKYDTYSLNEDYGISIPL